MVFDLFVMVTVVVEMKKDRLAEKFRGEMCLKRKIKDHEK